MKIAADSSDVHALLRGNGRPFLLSNGEIAAVVIVKGCTVTHRGGGHLGLSFDSDVLFSGSLEMAALAKSMMEQAAEAIAMQARPVLKERVRSVRVRKPMETNA